MNRTRMLLRADAMCDGAAWAYWMTNHMRLAIGFWCTGLVLFFLAIWSRHCDGVEP